VHDHAGCIEHAAQPRTARVQELVAQPLVQVAGLGAGANFLARPFEHRAPCRNCERIVHAANELVDRREVAQLH
jgi:hypothetical protein